MALLRWGILGTAKIARDFVLTAIQTSRNGRIAALASRDAARGAALCARYGIRHLLPDYDALLASPAVDAVYIPLPTSMHANWTRRALEAGKHVLCEKPIGMTVAEVEGLVEARDRCGRVAAEGFMVAHHPQWHDVRRWLQEGAIGRLRMVEGCFTYHNVDPDNVRNRLELGGGGVRDIGVYPVVTTRIATGAEPVRVVAAIERDPHFGTDRFALCRFDFPDFELSFYVGTQLQRRQHMTFHGEHGWIRLDAPFNPGVYDAARVTLRRSSSPGDEVRIYPRDDQYRLMIENFGDAADGVAPPAFPLESSLANQRAIDMIFASAEPSR